MKCINLQCQKEIGDMLFCPYCGTKQEKPKVFCGYCGAEMDYDAVYCNNCGRKSFFIQQKEEEEARKREAEAKAEKERQAQIMEKELKAKEAAETEKRRLQEKRKAEKKAEKARKEAERKALKAIDLGLPSGTKWADEDVDGYYAWGEIMDKEEEGYDVENYVHCDGDSESMHRIGSDICGTQYDVAYVKWGGKWRMPTIEQFEELIANCDVEAEDGFNWIKVTSKINGNKIYIRNDGHAGKDSYVDGLILWSGNEGGILCFAKCLYIYMDGDEDYDSVEISEAERYLGGIIRPVLIP